MSKYIIDPTLLYWMNVLGAVKVASIIFSILFTITSIGFASAWIYNWQQKIAYGDEDCEKYILLCKKITIVCGILGVFFIILCIFVPSKTTSIEMIVAKTATLDNLNWTAEQAKEIIKFIVNSVKDIL